uniref:BPTI/Kunitz inhibitor domain-containing protein n=1 Tax=Poecilia reticulata TaxID=8081 RepID=A0A3P9PG45_POERE
ILTCPQLSSSVLTFLTCPQLSSFILTFLICVCLLARNSGGCRKPSVVWFHDARTGRCARFLYNGCGGNQNRFRTRERCSGPVPKVFTPGSGSSSCRFFLIQTFSC